VADRDSVGGNTAGFQLLPEGPANGDQMRRFPQAPPVEQIVHVLLRIRVHVAVMKRNPAIFAPQAGTAHQEVRLNVVRLDDIRFARFQDLAYPANHCRIEPSFFVDDVHRHARPAGCGNESVVSRIGVSALVGRQGEFDGWKSGRRMTRPPGEFQQIFGGTRDEIRFHYCQDTDHLLFQLSHPV
jgi:hypothetical protein